jgi:hypothetical protein
MSNKIYQYPDNHGPNRYWFHCPGCGYDYHFTVGASSAPIGVHVPRWTFNGSFDKPTFAPSLLCNKNCPDSRCHSFVNAGKIQFLGDCWHKLKNETVELPDWEDQIL